MRLNDDLSIRTLVHADSLDWVPSPSPGVERRMLFRIGEEKARATSIVRYAPGSRFAAHGHPGGEEFLVLDGVFQDETGDFPLGTYVRNPPGTTHAPRSGAGCTIFVKLWQFHGGDLVRVVRDPEEGASQPRRPGAAASKLLFAGAGERVWMEDWKAGADVTLAEQYWLELLVLEGGFHEGSDELTRWSWLRLPPGQTLHAKVGPAGARVWWKSTLLPLENMREIIPKEKIP